MGDFCLTFFLLSYSLAKNTPMDSFSIEGFSNHRTFNIPSAWRKPIINGDITLFRWPDDPPQALILTNSEKIVFSRIGRPWRSAYMRAVKAIFRKARRRGVKFAYMRVMSSASHIGSFSSMDPAEIEMKIDPDWPHSFIKVEVFFPK